MRFLKYLDDVESRLKTETSEVITSKKIKKSVVEKHTEIEESNEVIGGACPKCGYDLSDSILYERKKMCKSCGWKNLNEYKETVTKKEKKPKYKIKKPRVIKTEEQEFREHAANILEGLPDTSDFDPAVNNGVINSTVQNISGKKPSEMMSHAAMIL